MEDEKRYPNWFLWLYEHFALVLILGVILGMIVIGSVAMLESRLTDIEDQLNYAPPRRYVPPNLQDYAADETTVAKLTNRQLVYVPVYSHIYYQEGAAYPLETTLSIRNIDTNQPIYIESVEYYDTSGKLAKTQVDQLIKLKPLQTIEFLIERRDSSGGSGANFLVSWGSNGDANKPLIESLMVGTAGAQAISFARTGVEIAAGETTDP